MTSYTVRKASPDKVGSDVVVVGVVQHGSGAKRRLTAAAGGGPVADAYGRRFGAMLSALGFKGGAGEAQRVPTSGTITARQLLLVGLGPEADVDADAVRRAAGVAARNLGNAASVALALPTADVEQVRAVVEGFGSGSYRYHGLKTGPAPTAVADVAVLTDLARRGEVREAVDASVELVETVNLSRDWVNLPPNRLTPQAFAEAVVALTKGRRSGVRAEIYDAERLEKLGCGGILAVGNSSVNPPCLVKLTWKPKGAKRHVALVGKGVTYDSGGLTIKPAQSMPHMKDDMAGAAAVAAAVHVAAARALPVAITAWLPAAENLISGSAMRPGDVITTHGGRTVEITNTDAEGRLLLADAFQLAVAEKPDVLVDIATLTGPAVVALGERIAALFGDDPTADAVETAAKAAGERVWRMPIPDDIAAKVRENSTVADLLQHDWVRWGSTLYAAAFLREFTDGVPWAHLDTAGPSYNTGAPWGHVPSGGTGFGTATLVEYLTRLGEG